MPQGSGYVPLWVKSNASLLEGASRPEELVERARELGLRQIALTDRNSVNGLVRALVQVRESNRQCHDLALRLIVGAEVHVGDVRVVLLAESREGYGNLCRLLSRGHARAEAKGQPVLAWEDVRTWSRGTTALAVCGEGARQLEASHRGHLEVILARHRTTASHHLERANRSVARSLGLSLVAAPEVLFHCRSRKPLQDALVCVRHGVRLHEAGALVRPNAEHELLAPADFARLYEDADEAVLRTREVAARCAFDLEALRYRYPEEKVPEGVDSRGWLRVLTFRGAEERYPEGIPADCREQIERELRLIEELDYGGYFLTMWDIVRFCRERAILCQGRGSAANSIVCFCLGITAIDPVRMDLLFERFLSRERAEPPDIDLDIEHQRREEVIQYVYERWGRVGGGADARAAMVANVIRYRPKSALRDFGKALDIPELLLDRLAKTLSQYDAEIEVASLEAAGIDVAIPAVRQLLALVQQVLDFPRHLGIHPGGFVLGSEPIDTLCVVEPATMPGRTVIQWDKQDIEDLGLFKVDLLGLGALSLLRGCFDLLRRFEETELAMRSVPAECPLTYAMMSRADTIGVFQIESRAQMAMLPRLRPRTFYDLVIEVAIVRPGPIQGDMVHPYLRRREGKEAVEFPHVKLESVLKKTLGVPIFQEQVMKLAVAVAGYTPGEADQLRRDMAAWRSKGRIEQHREKLVGRMVEDGIPLEFAERVFLQIRGFGEYGFPESHAASFALIAYATAWMKCHHPAVFACALLNAWPMGFYQPATIVEDAKRHGVVVLPVDVRKSDWECTLEAVPRGHWGIRMGLRFVRGLGVREREVFEACRREGPVADLADLVRRTGWSERVLRSLAEAGALASLDGDHGRRARRSQLWEASRLARLPRGLPLGGEHREEAPWLRVLGRHEAIRWDLEAAQHSVEGHPMELLREHLASVGIPEASRVAQMRPTRDVVVAGKVICRQRPATATGVVFMTLEDETGFVNIVIWNDVFERHAVVAKTAGFLVVRGSLQVDGGVSHVVADSIQELGAWLGRGGLGASRSRDFH